MVHVALGQKHRVTKRKRQVVFEDAVARTPVLGIGEIDQAAVAGLGAKRKAVDIAAQGAGDLHVASNQDNWQACGCFDSIRATGSPCPQRNRGAARRRVLLACSF